MAIGSANLGLTALLLLAVPGCAQCAPPRKLDRSSLSLVFDESFKAQPDFWDAHTNPRGRWKTNFFFGVQDADDPKGWSSRTIAVNGEQQYYAKPTDVPTAFDWREGRLGIVARPNPDRSRLPTHGLPFVSGLITTEKSLLQPYGYFEARVALPVGKGLWPAFWLLPEPRTEKGHAVDPGGQEIDIFESIGEPGVIYQTVFTADGGAKVRDARAFATSRDLAQFHNYGVLVTESKITWYFDDVETRRIENRDFRRPAYMLLNLAVGGNWPGAPDSATHFPAVMQIAWVRAYRIASTKP